MNIKSYGTVACVVVAFPLLHVIGSGTLNFPEDSFRDSRGQELMSALAVPEGDESQAFASWSYPTSIVIRSIPYQIDVEWHNIGCKVFSTNNLSEPVAEASMKQTGNGKKARAYGLGGIAVGCSLMTETLANKLSVAYLDPATNTLFVSWKSQDYRHKNYLICKNLILGIRAHTNALDFAVAILNAGLPEAERIVLPPQE